MLATTRAALAALLLPSLTISASAYASPTSPDHGFGTDGVLTFHSASHDEILADMAVLPNGKTVLVMVTEDEPALEVYRLNKNGTRDTSFGGGDGLFAFGLASNYEDVHLAVDPQTGKSYVTTFLDNGSTSPTTVWRIKANGTLDAAYGGSNTGHVTFNKRLANGLLPLPGGKLMMAGDNFATHTADVWRISNAGSADHPFGNGGKVVLSADPFDEASSLVRQPDGKVVVAVSHFDPAASTLNAFRLKQGGALDPSFSGDGTATINPSSAGVTTSTVWSPQVLIRPDGRTVYVAGLNQNAGGFRNSLVVAGLTKAGKPDRVFGKHVYTEVDETSGQAALQRDGKLVVAGSIPPNPSSFNAVARFTTKGTLDPSWSGDGILTLTGSFDLVSTGITARGRVMVGRTTGSGPFDGEVRALRGTRTPSCHGRLATQFGSGKANTITGTPGDDVLVGLGGKDTLKGLGGNDVLCGNDGPDRLLGGAGDDYLNGGPGKDRLVGGPGVDILKP